MQLRGIIGVFFLLALIGSVSAAGVTVSVADSPIGTGGKADIPVTVSGADNMAGMDLTVTYDTAVLKFNEVKQGDLTKKGLIEAKEVSPGQINIGFVNPAGITGDGTLLTISFFAVGEKGSTSQVQIMNRGAFNLDRLDVPLTVNSGTVTVGDKAIAPVETGTIIGAVMLVIIGAAAYSRKRE